jgi:hypothetical protein
LRQCKNDALEARRFNAICSDQRNDFSSARRANHRPNRSDHGGKRGRQSRNRIQGLGFRLLLRNQHEIYLGIKAPMTP